MTLVQIPSLAEIGAGIGLVAGGACDKASSAVQHFINTPSVAENGLNLLAAQIDVLEQLVAALREVAVGIEAVHDKLAITVELEWQSPAGNLSAGYGSTPTASSGTATNNGGNSHIS